MSYSAEQIRFCTSRDGTRIAYGVSGEGPPLIWSPHWVHHLELDWGSPIWRPWLSLLTRRHTLVRYDWRGCGLSDRDNVTFSLEQHLDDLTAVIDACGFQRFAFFGHGSGGTNGIAYAARHPERVSHLVLSGSPLRGRCVRAKTDAQRQEAETRLKVFEIGWDNESPAAYGHFVTALHIPDAQPEQVQSYNELVRQVTTAANAIALLRSYWHADVSKFVSQLRCPALVLHARQDALIPFEEGRLIASLVPGAQFVPLDTRNHVLLEHEPSWPQFATILDAFLSAPPAPTADCELECLSPLTARENEVLEFLAQGHDNETIAARLGISAKTVRNQVSIIFSKLGVNSRAQAIVRARDAGFGRKIAR